jgi:hypothetical protein
MFRSANNDMIYNQIFSDIKKYHVLLKYKVVECADYFMKLGVFLCYFLERNPDLVKDGLDWLQESGKSPYDFFAYISFNKNLRGLYFIQRMRNDICHLDYMSSQTLEYFDQFFSREINYDHAHSYYKGAFKYLGSEDTIDTCVQTTPTVEIKVEDEKTDNQIKISETEMIEIDISSVDVGVQVEENILQKEMKISCEVSFNQVDDDFIEDINFHEYAIDSPRKLIEEIKDESCKEVNACAKEILNYLILKKMVEGDYQQKYAIVIDHRNSRFKHNGRHYVYGKFFDLDSCLIDFIELIILHDAAEFKKKPEEKSKFKSFHFTCKKDSITLLPIKMNPNKK